MALPGATILEPSFIHTTENLASLLLPYVYRQFLPGTTVGFSTAH